MTDKKPYDTAFKHLAEQDPEALLRLVGALPPDAKVRVMPREISAPALAADQPYEVIGENLHYIAHLEEQTRWKQDVPNRIVEYDALFWINFHLPVRSFVLVLIPDGLPLDAPTEAIIHADGLTLTARFTIVRLWEISAADALAQASESLLPFIPLMQGGKDLLERCAREVARIKDETERRELALHFVSIGSLRYNRENLIDLLGRMTMIPDHVLRETPYIQSIIEEVREEVREEAMEEGRQEGRQEGLQEGRQEGRQEGYKEGREVAVKMLLHAIGQRFPSLNISAEIERIHDLEVLKQLFFDLDQIADEASLRRHLATLSSSTQD